MIINFTAHHLMLIYTNRISDYFCIALLCTQYCLIIKTKQCSCYIAIKNTYVQYQYMHTHTT